MKGYLLRLTFKRDCYVFWRYDFSGYDLFILIEHKVFLPRPMGSAFETLLFPFSLIQPLQHSSSRCLPSLVLLGFSGLESCQCITNNIVDADIL
jgi:hypothetical protein